MAPALRWLDIMSRIYACPPATGPNGDNCVKFELLKINLDTLEWVLYIGLDRGA